MHRIRHPWQHARCCVCGRAFTAAAWPTRFCQRCNLKKFTRSTDYRIPLVDVDLSTPEDNGQLRLINEECDSGYCFM